MKSASIALWGLLTVNAVAGEFSVRRLAPSPEEGRSGAVRVDHADLIYSGQVWSKRGGDLPAQLSAVGKQTADLLSSVGLRPSDVVKLNVYVADDGDVAEITRGLKTYFGEDTLPAVSWVTTPLPEPENKEKSEKKEKETKGAAPDQKPRVGLDFVAARKPSPASKVMPAAEDGMRPLAVIPASATSRVFVSGQAEKGDGTVADATKQTMASLFRTLDFVELSRTDVVQVKAFIAPMTESPAALKAIREAFAPAAAPPIVLVEWEAGSLPVEIELVAATRRPLPAKRPAVEYLTPPGMKQSPVYSRVARVQSPALIFVSGLYGAQSDPDSEAELRELFAQTKALAEDAGSDLKHLVKATYYVSSKGSSDQHNALRPEYYDPARPPAASKAIVKGVGRPGRTITWDMVATPKE